jgi:hypothetical protein
MPDVSFAVQSVEPMRLSATPVLVLRLNVSNRGTEEIHSIALNCQLQIEPAQRTYSKDEKELLHDVFGEPERWGTTVQPLFWTSLNTSVGSFTGSASVDLRVPCSFDFSVAATKYFYAMEDGEIPVVIFFSGTIFYISGGGLQIAPIPWSSQATCRISAQTWKEMMRIHYPQTAWFGLRRDIFDRLYRYKVRNGLPTWEQMMEHVLAAAGEHD